MGQYFSDPVMQETARWGRWFAVAWVQAPPPMKIHSGSIAPDGSPEWHPDFARWITTERAFRGGDGRDEQRYRTTKVMRRLRRVSVRSFEVTYRVLVLNERLRDTTTWLNERAERNGIPFPPHRPDGPHYTEKDAMALLIAGVSFAQQSY